MVAGTLTRLGGTVVGLALLVTVLAMPVPRPETSEAASFLRGYFAVAVRDPNQAWDLLSEPGQREYLRRPGATEHGYAAYFDQFDQIEVSELEPRDSHSRWHALVTYHRPTGPALISSQSFVLQCPWLSKLWGVGCTRSNLKLDSVTVHRIDRAG